MCRLTTQADSAFAPISSSYYTPGDNSNLLTGSDTAELTVTRGTQDALAPGAEYTINYSAETITINSGYEVNMAQDFSGTFITSGGSISSYIGKTLYIRRVATKNRPPDSAGTAILLTRPSVPSVQGAMRPWRTEATAGLPARIPRWNTVKALAEPGPPVWAIPSRAWPRHLSGARQGHGQQICRCGGGRDHPNRGRAHLYPQCRRPSL